MSWDAVVRKFEQLSEPHTTPELRRQIPETVQRLESLPIRALTDLLGKVSLNVKG